MTRSHSNAGHLIGLAFVVLVLGGALASREPAAGEERSHVRRARAATHGGGLLEKIFTPLPVDGNDLAQALADEESGRRRTPAPPSLPPETRALLARRHAPEMRFNGWIDMPDPSDANHTE